MPQVNQSECERTCEINTVYYHQETSNVLDELVISKQNRLIEIENLKGMREVSLQSSGNEFQADAQRRKTTVYKCARITYLKILFTAKVLNRWLNCKLNKLFILHFFKSTGIFVCLY